MRAITPAIAPQCAALLPPLRLNRPCPLRVQARFKTIDARQSDASAGTASLSPRWLSDVKQRIGKCITFGLKPDQNAQAGVILREIARDWRELVAGSEGFLTGPRRRGTFRHQVVWGDQDSMG